MEAMLRRIYNAMPRSVQRLAALAAGRAEITKFPPRHHQDGLATAHWSAHATDKKFQTAYMKAVDEGLAVDPKIEWRAHVVCWAAANGLRTGGAFVECGVNRGFLSRIIIDYLGVEEVPAFYLLDTYSGFSEKYLSASEAVRLKMWHQKSGRQGSWQAGMYDDCYDDVVKTFSDCPQVRIVRGTVPETLPEVKEEKIGYLSLDMNCAMPEIAALEYFWPNMMTGAYVVMDDYGFTGHEEQRDAFNDWAGRKNVPLLSLPTGQGLLVKL
jgi:hypothetical protein